MSDGAMAFDARSRFAFGTRVRHCYRFRDFRVTFLASLFGHCQIARFDLNWLVKGASGEIKRMPKAIRCFGRILGNEPSRRVAIVASRSEAMRRFQPAIILLVHHVTVRTRSGVIGEVRSAFGIDEGVSANADSNAHRGGHHHQLHCPFIHAVAPKKTCEWRWGIFPATLRSQAFKQSVCL